ncbi:hypothetical protein H6P81_018779 [Aristolochia fimbriata]|uniref:Uncharacterized protein n=1 Tax=Aristolochia fimbriata TaxID=158543 RepID=A0AAV7E204_ARIFI|nr:hypothetical protein H6P81_018779 [Aristolochia fimbriata]
MEQEEEDVFEGSGVERSEMLADEVRVEEQCGVEERDAAGDETQGTQFVGSSSTGADSYQMGEEGRERGNLEAVADCVGIGSGGEVRETDGPELGGAVPSGGLHVDEGAVRVMGYSQIDSVSELGSSSLHGGEVGKDCELDASMPISDAAVGSPPRGGEVHDMEDSLSMRGFSFAGDEVAAASSPVRGGEVHDMEDTLSMGAYAAGSSVTGDEVPVAASPLRGGEVHDTKDSLPMDDSRAAVSSLPGEEVPAASSSLRDGEVHDMGGLLPVGDSHAADSSFEGDEVPVAASPLRGEEVHNKEDSLSKGDPHAAGSSFPGEEVPVAASPLDGALPDGGIVNASSPEGAGKEFDLDDLQPSSAHPAAGSSPRGDQVNETEGLLSISDSSAVASFPSGGEVRAMTDSQPTGVSHPIGSDSHIDELDEKKKQQCADPPQLANSSLSGDEVREVEEPQTDGSQIIESSKNVGSSLVGDETYGMGIPPDGILGTIPSPTVETEVCEFEGSKVGPQFNVASEPAGSPKAGSEFHETEGSKFIDASQPISSAFAADEICEGHEYNEDALEIHSSPMNEDGVAGMGVSAPLEASQSFTSPRGDLHERQEPSPMNEDEVAEMGGSASLDTSQSFTLPIDDLPERKEPQLTDSAPPVCFPTVTDEGYEMENPQLMGQPQTVGFPPGKEIQGMEDTHLIDGQPSSSPSDGNEIYRMEEAEFFISSATVGSPLDVLMEEKEVQEEAEDGEEGPAESKGGKRKRGRPGRVQTRSSTRRKEEEDVCFICFDGGNLVLCDRRGCPKAYHPSCVNRDEAFFRSKGKWNCGWHICSSCEKASQYMCYTCTFSLCKGCIKETGFFCIRGNKGFCETCMRTVMLIEKNEQENKGMGAVNFDDKNSWEYLFKEYWLDLKRKLSLTLQELSKAKTPKSSGASARNDDSSDELYDAKNDPGSGSDSSSPQVEGSKPSKKKAKKRSRLTPIDKSVPSAPEVVAVEQLSLPEDRQWASPELLEFVSHMRNGDTSVLSQYDVQALLLEYIKQNKLRDPRRKSQIICDSRLINLFGKARVGHFEMLKLLESHFLIKEDPSEADVGQDAVTDTEAIPVETDGNIDGTRMDKRKRRGKKGEERVPQSNLDDYAAIDVHNINLIYLRRNLMEDLLEDMETFQEKVVGAFVRIRISGAGQKQDMYRLVQVVGIGKAAETYKTGKRTTDVTLEILNLNKTEIISIDTISNQEFSEEECKRLRQSIKCGFINRLSVGEVQVKARALQTVRVNDWLETEILRLSHLRDRASEKGRRKEYPLELLLDKDLQVLNSPDERARRLQELPEVHADPNMDPSHESDEEEADAEDKKRDFFRPRDSGYSRRGKENISLSARKTSSTWEQSRNTTIKGASWDRADPSTVAGERIKEASWYEGGDASNAGNWDSPIKVAAVAAQPVLKSAPVPPNPPATPNINEAEKMWHYKDPSGKVQGPFSMAQLRKWNATGYFPADLKIWRTSESQDDSFLLTDALAGKFQKDLPEWEPPKAFYSGSSVPDSSNANRQGGWAGNQSYGVAAPKVEVKGAWVGNPSQGWDMSRVPSNNGLSSQSQGPTNSTPAYRGREDRNAHDAARWNSGQSHGNSWNTDQSAGFQPNILASSAQQQTLSIRTEVWSPNQTSQNDFSNPPTPTPSLSSGGWIGNQTTNPGWGTTGVTIPAPQQSSSTTAPNRIGGGWGHPAPLVMPDNRNESFNPPTPTPKPSSVDWGNSSNPGSLQPPVMLKEITKLDRLTHSSVSPTHDRNQNAGVLAQEQVPSERSPGSAIPIPQMVHAPSEQPPGGKGQISLPAEETLQFSSQNQVSLSGSQGSQAVSHIVGPIAQRLEQAGLSQQPATAGWGLSQSQKPDMVTESAGLPNTWTGPPNANGDKWSTPATEPKAKPSRWGPALNDGGAQSQKTSLPPAANWQSSSSNPATGWGATPENTSKGWVPPGPEGHNPNPGPGAAPSGNASAGWGGAAPSGNANAGWGGAAPPGNANPGWGVAAQGNTNGSWGPTGALPQGNTNAAWVPPAGQVNPNTGWGGQPQGNVNTGWGSTGGNPGSWGGNGNHNGERYPGHGDRGFQGGNDSGQGGGRQHWNRPSFGGGRGPPGPPSRGQRVCKFHENGHCKKGAACDYLHT